MQLASEEIVVSVGNSSVELVPSLRAALRIARRYGGFAEPIRAVLDGSVRLLAELIEIGADIDNDIPDLLVAIDLQGVGLTLAQLQEPLAKFVLALAGVDHDDTPAAPAPAKPAGKPVSYVDHFERLFGIATGWLGWTPDTAWSATPAEILAAYNGRVEMLKAIYGSNDPDAEPDLTDLDLNPDGTDPAFDRAGLERLRALSGKAHA